MVSGYARDDPYKNRDPRLNATIIYPDELFEGSIPDNLPCQQNG